MRIGFRVLMAGALLSAPLLPGAVAQAGRVSGQVSVVTDDGAIKVVSINAVTKSDGSASGQIEMDDPSPIPDQDVDGTGEIDLSESPSGVRLIAKVNCLAVKGAAAVVGGLVVESDVPRYMGKQVLLFVEDSVNARGRFSWGFYEPEQLPRSCGSFPFGAYSPREVAGGSVRVVR